MSITYPNAHLPLLGKGSILFDRFDSAGASTGFQHLANCETFAITQEDEIKELFSSLNASVSRIASATGKREVKVKITGTDFGADRMAIVLMGSKTTFTQTGASIVAEALVSTTQPKKGRYYQTAKRSISAVTVKQGATTLVAGTDYDVADAAEGLIYFRPAGAVNESLAVTIDYTHAAITSLDKVVGATTGLAKGRLKYVPDPSDGPKIMVDIWRVNLSPSGELGLISDDYGKWELNGLVLDDTANHATEPYYTALYI